MKVLNLIDQAQLLALNSKMSYGKHAAFIVKKNKIIASGINNDRTHFLNGSSYASCHAEIDALMNLLRQYNAFPRSKNGYCFLRGKDEEKIK